MICVYDGTWSGMLTLVYRTAHEGFFPDDIVRLSSINRTGVLLGNTEIVSDPVLAEATNAVLGHRIDGQCLADACLALMSERGGIDLAVWTHLLRLWNRGDRVARDLASECTSAVFHAARYSFREFHRWMGLVRLQDVGRGYYAALAPECDILPLLADHFCRRLPDRWVLHDVRRKRAALHEKGRWILKNTKFSFELIKTSDEELFQTLWQEFFRSTSVKERKDVRRQMRFLPKRTWPYLIERPSEAGR